MKIVFLFLFVLLAIPSFAYDCDVYLYEEQTALIGKNIVTQVGLEHLEDSGYHWTIKESNIHPQDKKISIEENCTNYLTLIERCHYLVSVEKLEDTKVKVLKKTQAKSVDEAIALFGKCPLD